MEKQNFDVKHKIIVFTDREIDKLELDSEDDFKDEIATRIKNENFVEVYSGWDYTTNYYVVIIRMV